MVEDLELPQSEVAVAELLISDIVKLTLWAETTLIEKDDKIGPDEKDNNLGRDEKNDKISRDEKDDNIVTYERDDKIVPGD